MHSSLLPIETRPQRFYLSFLPQLNIYLVKICLTSPSNQSGQVQRRPSTHSDKNTISQQKTDKENIICQLPGAAVT